MRNIDKAIQRESVQPTLHCKSIRNKSDCKNMSHNVVVMTDENDQMSHSYTTVTVNPNVLIFNETALELSHALDQQRWLSVWRHG